ncbi:neocarzinostatin apoprotein domain-containing protein [Corynebacterium lactis]|nr:neocarzinostatin apoprotein domain-containing protein [Corynebacterium lactis]
MTTSHSSGSSRLMRRAGIVAVPAIAALPLLAACGSDNAQEAQQSAAEMTSSASSKVAEAAGAEDKDAKDKDAEDGKVTIDADPVSDLKDGDTITVTVSGLDPESGYYAGICAAEKTPGNPVPDCTGDRTEGARSQQWITNKPGGVTPIETDGTAKFDLAAGATGEKVNCSEQECVLKLFGDHTEGFEDVAEVPVTFAK